MRIELLGHATLIVRTANTSILFDPVLMDTHHHGLYQPWPARVLSIEQLLPITAVVISHRHLDHFDLPSLAILPRDMPVFVPNDPVIIATLHELGFDEVSVVASMESFTVNDCELTPTPPGADAGAIENGYVISSDGRTVWNVIDTIPSRDSIAEVKARFKTVDLAIVPWQPLLDADVATSDSPPFPINSYRRLLENAFQIRSTSLALGACGFCATKRFDWLNHLMFPVRQAQAVADLLRGEPQWRDRLFVPVSGDALVVTDKTNIERQALPYCSALPELDVTQIEWRPWQRRFAARAASLPALSEQEWSRITVFMEQELPEFISAQASEFFWHFAWGLSRRVVVYGRDEVRSWWLKFDQRGATMSRQCDPTSVNCSVITTEALVALCGARSAWSYVVLNGDYWDSGVTYATRDGIVECDGRDYIEPLRAFFGGDDRFAETVRYDLTQLEETAS